MPPKRATGPVPETVVDAVTKFLHEAKDDRSTARQFARDVETEHGVKRARLLKYIKDRQARNPRLNATEEEVCEAAAELRRQAAMLCEHKRIRNQDIAERLQEQSGRGKFRSESRVQNTTKKHKDLSDPTKDEDFGDLAKTSQRETDLRHHTRV